MTQHEYDTIVDLVYNGGAKPSLWVVRAIMNNNFSLAASRNAIRGKANNVPQNRITYENTGIEAGKSCT